MHRAYHSGQFRSAALSASHTVHELSRQESLPGQDFASTYACIIATAPRLFVRNLRSVSDSALSHKPLPNYTLSRDERTLGSGRNHDSIPYRRQDIG